MADHDKSKKTRDHWPLRVFLIAVSLSAVMSFCSSAALEDSGIWIPILVLAIFIALGIVFDMIGVAVTAADPKPFHSMAAHGEKGGREAIRLLNMSNKVSSLCNDVVGDICGIVSGGHRHGAAAQLFHHHDPHFHRHHGAYIRSHHRRKGSV